MPKEFAAGIRKAETGAEEGNYEAMSGLVRGQARRLGAYGIASDEWPRLAAEAGYPGARWQDKKAQDAVAMATFNALYEKYQDWRLVAIAWKAGEKMADAVMEDSSILEHETLTGLAKYAESVTAGVDYASPEKARSASQFSKSPGPPGPVGPGFAGDTREAQAEESLRGVLYALRSRQRSENKANAVVTEEVTPDGN